MRASLHLPREAAFAQSKPNSGEKSVLMVALQPRMKYPFNAMCVFLPSYNVALAPHVLTPIAELKTGGRPPCQTPGTLPTSPSGLLNTFCLPQPPTSTPLEIFSVDTDAADRRRDPVRLKTETPTTCSILTLRYLEPQPTSSRARTQSSSELVGSSTEPFVRGLWHAHIVTGSSHLTRVCRQQNPMQRLGSSFGSVSSPGDTLVLAHARV
ncbi:hypothetical protein B0H14DRAFT_2586994 [Mycena olivaceomarginata]|nr:hypothetical protein B0H14DRAFT_2586994 [Mycena olivaceomarginata]